MITAQRPYADHDDEPERIGYGPTLIQLCPASSQCGPSRLPLMGQEAGPRGGEDNERIVSLMHGGADGCRSGPEAPTRSVSAKIARIDGSAGAVASVRA
jgi:hypothetical protein